MTSFGTKPMNTNRLKFRVLLYSTLMAVACGSAAAQDKASLVAEKEAELLGVLRGDGPAADKAIACKNLAIYGSAASVQDLAKLLPNPQLSSWARIALEAIPGPEADQALREATQSLTGKLLVGTINSIGFRQDPAAVDILAARLRHEDTEVACAAAVALGHIGNAAAVQTLRSSLASAPAAVRSAIAEGCVLCAERLLSDGKSAEATEVYDEIRHADVPQQRIIEATRGAILARSQDGIPLLLEQFRSPEKTMFQLALGTAREFPGSAVDQALADELAQTPPERAALLIHAMADREQTVILAAILKAAEKGPFAVRLAAIDALRRVGNDSCLTSLLQIAADSETALATAAKQTLAELPGQHVDGEIGVLLPTARGKTQILLLDLVGQRRIESALPDLLTAVDHTDSDVRHAAMIALGQTVSLQRLPVLISQFVAPRYPEDSAVAHEALRAASVRMPDREACAAELTAAMTRAPSASKSPLLEILSEVGGSTALQTLGTAANSNDPELQDTGSRLLGKWNSVDAAPVLLHLAKSAPAEKYQVRALRGYVGLVRKFAMSDQQRAEMCETAMLTAIRSAEKQLVLDVLELYPSAETLKVAVDALQDPQLKSRATRATLVIARKLGGKGVNVQKLLAGAGLDQVKLDIVKAQYGAGSAQKDVTEVIRQRASDLPLITLTSASYNASFGGDPAPGTVKQLKIQYRINGKPGEASFPENALIILPMPK